MLTDKDNVPLCVMSVVLGTGHAREIESKNYKDTKCNTEHYW